jgi:hypothetical protein
VTVSVWSEGRERGKQKTAPCIISAERLVDATSFFLLNAAVDKKDYQMLNVSYLTWHVPKRNL